MFFGKFTQHTPKSYVFVIHYFRTFTILIVFDICLLKVAKFLQKTEDETKCGQSVITQVRPKAVSM